MIEKLDSLEAFFQCLADSKTVTCLNNNGVTTLICDNERFYKVSSGCLTFILGLSDKRYYHFNDGIGIGFFRVQLPDSNVRIRIWSERLKLGSRDVSRMLRDLQLDWARFVRDEALAEWDRIKYHRRKVMDNVRCS